MKQIQMIIIIGILLGAVTPSSTIASQSPRDAPPQGPPPGYGVDRGHGDDRGYDEYQPRADVGFFYDELSPAADPKQKDKKGKKEDHKGRLEMRGDTLEWMDLRHPGDGFEIRIPGPEKVWHTCELRPSESFCYQLNPEPRLSGYVIPTARSVTIFHNPCPRGRSDCPGRVAAPG